MKTVSFQGTQITAGQRRQLAFQQQARAAFLNPVLAESIDQTIQLLAERKEQGAKPERVWFLDYESKGTPFVGDCFGY